MRFFAILAAVVGASQLFTLPVQAATYTFTAGADVGAFTTGAASPVNSGYFLLTDFDFTTLNAGDPAPLAVDFVQFALNAAFDPVLDQFISGDPNFQATDEGGLGGLVVEGGLRHLIEIHPFEVGDPLTVVDEGGDSFAFSSGVFTVTSSLASPAPEPSAWALMIAGIGGVGLMLRRQGKSLGLELDKA